MIRDKVLLKRRQAVYLVLGDLPSIGVAANVNPSNNGDQNELSDASPSCDARPPSRRPGPVGARCQFQHCSIAISTGLTVGALFGVRFGAAAVELALPSSVPSRLPLTRRD
jgi:hypothetical protein